MQLTQSTSLVISDEEEFGKLIQARERLRGFLDEYQGPANETVPPLPTEPGAYEGDTYYANGGTVATHRWDGSNWWTL